MDEIKKTKPTDHIRKEIVRRFEAWLDETLANEPEPEGLAAEILTEMSAEAPQAQVSGNSELNPQKPNDLYSVWSALTAATQEVKLQGRAFKRLSESLAPLEGLESSVRQSIEAHAKTLSEAQRREEEIRLEAQRASRKEMLDMLLDVRDRLERGSRTASQIRHDAGQNMGISHFSLLLPGMKGSLQTVQEITAALEQGYLLSLDQIADVMERFGVRTLNCLGTPLDPTVMKVVDVENAPDVIEGTVVEVYRPGYTWNGCLFRPAEVKVARGGQRTEKQGDPSL